MKLAANAARDVNKQCDEYGMKYSRKAMTRFGLSKRANELWEVLQLFPHLQTIANKFRENADDLNSEDEH